MTMRSILAAAMLAMAAPLSAAAPAGAVVSFESAQSGWLAGAEGKPPVDAIMALIEEDTRLYVRGGPVTGREAARKLIADNPLNQGKSTRWTAIKSGLSSDGTHGYAFGYFDVAGGDAKVANRLFLTYWVKGATGWKVAAMKMALRQPDLALLPAQPLTAPANAKTGQKPDHAAAEASLKAAEKAFSDRANETTLPQAFTEFGRPDSINYGRLGSVAIGQALAQQGSGPTPINWSADDVLVAPSGDLGITFGHIRPNGKPEPGQPPAAPFFTIWMRDSLDSPWRYVAE